MTSETERPEQCPRCNSDKKEKTYRPCYVQPHPWHASVPEATPTVAEDYAVEIRCAVCGDLMQFGPCDETVMHVKPCLHPETDSTAAQSPAAAGSHLTEKELQQRRVKQYEDRIPCGNCGHVHLGCCSVCNKCSQIVPPVTSPVRAPESAERCPESFWTAWISNHPRDIGYERRFADAWSAERLAVLTRENKRMKHNLDFIEELWEERYRSHPDLAEARKEIERLTKEGDKM